MIAIFILAFIVFCIAMVVLSRAVHEWRSKDNDDF